jgi:outer membrane cobalamin receptor
MKQLKQFLLLAVVLFGTALTAVAQGTVKGRVVDAENEEPLIGATISVQGSTQGTVTDYDGYFELKVSSGRVVLQFRYLGYVDKNQTVSVKHTTDVGNVALSPDSKTLGDVVVTSTIAVARKTPVAVSNVMLDYIEERMGSQEFVEILKSTPGVHANKQGGGYGDSEIYMRGFDNTNTATMINGVPVNDMENGTVYQSNWSGLRDVVNVMQTQRGVGASKVSAPSIGGTINIITKGAEAKKGGTVSYQLGSYGQEKMLFSVSTGMSEKGWALSMLGARETGEKAPQGSDYEGYTYFMSLAKRLGDNHQLTLTAFGSPQWHNQRTSYSALTIQGWHDVEKLYGVTNYRYNATYGFDNNGQQRTGDRNVYHKPQISLNHQWNINEKSSLSTVAYVSIGRGYGYAGEANEDYGYSYTDWRGGSYGTLYTKYRKSDGTFDYGAIQDINANSEYGSMLVMSKSKNYHNWYGLLSTYTTKIGENIDFYGGIDYRYYKGTHTNEIIDLYDGAYYMDSSRGDVDAANNYHAADPAWRYQKLGVGDVIYRDYDGHVMQEGAFFQAEYSKDKIAAFLSGSFSNTTYWRYDRYYYDEAHARSKTINYQGFTVKGGANYNINENHNVFANLGFVSRAPKFSAAFMQSTTSNAVNTEARNEKVFMIDLGYGYKSRSFSANVTAYYTNWMDKSMTKYGTLGQAQTEYYLNMTGVDALHKGVEVDFKYRPLRWLDINGMFSMGDWKWNSNATGYAYNELGQPLTSSGTVTTLGAADHASATINLKGVRVGGSAQTTASLGFNANVGGGIRFGGDWTYYGRNYAYYSLSGSNLSLGKEVNVLDPWRIPCSSTVDVHASYKFKLAGFDATLSGNINNLLNYQYILKAWNPNTVASTSTPAATADNIYCFFDSGRTMTVRLKLNF